MTTKFSPRVGFPPDNAARTPSRVWQARPRRLRGTGSLPRPLAETTAVLRRLCRPRSGPPPRRRWSSHPARVSGPGLLAPIPANVTAQSAAPSARPGLGFIPTLLRLTLEDIFSGSGPAVVTNPTAVVTGLFNQVLRKAPTDNELQNYLNLWSLTGVNGVVAGLYSSGAFRQSVVSNYYLELLGRTPTQTELFWGSTQLMLGRSESMFAASLAGGKEFYADSATGGGTFGTRPSANTYVNLLYRTLLGQATDPISAAIYVQRLQAGQPVGLIAREFVTTDVYRAVKVAEIFQVLGQTASSTEISGYVRNWLFEGGLAGIATSLLATSTNVQRIEGGQVTLPDMDAVADLQTLLLADYTDNPDGFVKLFNQLLSLDVNNPIGETNPCTPSNTSCNQALFQLMTTGGTTRGMPNSSLALTSLEANVATLVPTQNEIDFMKSLFFPLTNAKSLQTFFAGGVIQPFGNPVVTANSGTYIVDGHHRWSQIAIVNPYTQVTALDLGYVPTPQEALKEAQFGVAAQKGYLASSTVDGENLFTMSQTVFNQRVREVIASGDETDKVLEVFGTYLGFDPETTPLEQQYTTVENYLWSNVLRMRELNPFIPGATSRAVMPQTDPLPLVQAYLASGALSYSFPTIAYLG